MPKEFTEQDIDEVEEANRFLKEVFIPAYNREFAIAPAEEGSAFVPWIGTNLDDILCIQEERVVRADNCVTYGKRLLQIPADRHRCHYVKAKVRVHAYPDDTLAVFHGPRCLARYDAQGKQLVVSHRQSRGTTQARKAGMAQDRAKTLRGAAPQSPRTRRGAGVAGGKAIPATPAG